MTNFCEVLKFLREKRGFSQAELAKRLGLAASTIGMYESGKREPNFETLELIADYFNVDMNYLLCNQAKPQPKGMDAAAIAKMLRVNEQFADMLKRRRLNIGLSIEEVALKANVDADRLRAFEEGELHIPDLMKIENIAKALQVTPSYLFGWKVGEIPPAELPLILEARAAFMALDEADQRTIIDMMKAQKLLRDAEAANKEKTNVG